MLDVLGWVATAMFASSYFFKTSRGMRRSQALAALVWVCYGVWMNALPIIVANTIVAVLACYTDLKEMRLSRSETRDEASPLPDPDLS
jgi:hypothetical protein